MACLKSNTKEHYFTRTLLWFACLLCLMENTFSQDYQVADIQCNFPSEVEESKVMGSHHREQISAKLKKPPGFRGSPLFADNRLIDPSKDIRCQIRRELQDPTGLVYNLLITDFRHCAVSKKDGYVTVRVWFPQLLGVVLATDQEVIIMCKPSSPTIIENRAAGFAGSLPSAGRVTGVVEESPGRLEYELVLLREITSVKQAETSHLVDQPVPLGSRLLLRARINTQTAAWKYIKMMQVTVSSDPQDPNTPERVVLVKNGCREPNFASIVPNQPKRARDDPGEVNLEFQAFMLDTRILDSSSQLWIHAKIKACILEVDCQPESCMDLSDPTGYGKRRKRNTKSAPFTVVRLGSNADSVESNFLPVESSLVSNSSTPKRPSTDLSYTEVGDNVKMIVVFPQKYFSQMKQLHSTCSTFIVLSICLGSFLLGALGFLCLLTGKLKQVIQNIDSNRLEKVVKNHHNKYGLRDFLQPPFQ